MSAPYVVICGGAREGERHYEVRGLVPEVTGPGSEPRFTPETLTAVIELLAPELFARLVDDFRLATEANPEGGFGGPPEWHRRAASYLEHQIRRRCP